jgi:hypothetical protein
MSEVRLLNSGATDAKVATEMVANLHKQVQDAERRLTAQRMNSYEEYVGAYEATAALRRALNEAERIFGRHFKI